MTQRNAEIVREYIEKVINAHRMDRIYEYLDKKCVFHNAPYVGLGFRSEDKPGEKMVVTQVLESGPSYGRLQVGDELVKISDPRSTAETFEQLRDGLLTRGSIGETVTITVRRNGMLLDFDLVRRRIDSFDLTIEDLFESYKIFFDEKMPDFKSEVNVILEEGDKVAYFETLSGTSTEFHASAVWAACSIARLEGGKIVEIWGIDDTLSQLEQMGYQVKEPVIHKG